jgi:hypothetical protein
VVRCGGAQDEGGWCMATGDGAARRGQRRGIKFPSHAIVGGKEDPLYVACCPLYLQSEGGS